MIVALVDDRAFAVLLRVEVARERGVARSRRVRQPDVGELAPGQLIDLAPVLLDPRARPKSVLVRYRDDRDEPGAVARSRLADANRRLVARRALEEAVEIRRRRDRTTIHLEQVIAVVDLNAGRAERRAQIRIPVLARVDVRDAILAVLDREVGA